MGNGNGNGNGNSNGNGNGNGNGHGHGHGDGGGNGTSNGHAAGDGNGASAAAGTYGRRRRVWPTANRGSQATRYRVEYEKEGLARFTSHLDLVRIFDRAIRVAKVPIAYTQGFNRHAKIAYGPPLTLGATSRAEYFDLDLAQACPWTTVLAMNEVLPEGLRIIDGKPLELR